VRERVREAILDFAWVLPVAAWLGGSALAAAYASTGVMLLVWFGGFGLLLAAFAWDGDWLEAIGVALSPILVIVGWIVFVLALVAVVAYLGS
jgi:hypothetical protein